MLPDELPLQTDGQLIHTQKENTAFIVPITRIE